MKGASCLMIDWFLVGWFHAPRITIPGNITFLWSLQLGSFSNSGM